MEAGNFLNRECLAGRPQGNVAQWRQKWEEGVFAGTLQILACPEHS